MDSSAAAGLTLATVGTAAGLFGQALPPPHAVAGKPATEANISYVRSRAAQTAVMVLAIGVGASLMARSPWPAVASAGVCGWLWWQYDQAATVDGGLD